MWWRWRIYLNSFMKAPIHKESCGKWCIWWWSWCPLLLYYCWVLKWTAGGIGGDRQGRPKGEYEAAGRDYGYAEEEEHIHCFCWLPLNLKHLFQMSFSSKTLWYLVKFKVIIYLCITRVTRVTRATIMTGKSSRDNVRMFQEGICQLFPSLQQHFYQ